MRAGRAPGAALAALVVLLLAFAWFRPIDHDESQYGAAAVLSGEGLLPYRDYAYLQTPLQPLLLAPVAALAGAWAYPVLRLVNALFAALAVAATWRAMRVAGVSAPIATTAAALFAASDILLFSAGTARNDALPCALLALALPLMIRAPAQAGMQEPPGESLVGRGTRPFGSTDWKDAGRAALIGLLLAAATAAKLSYALPALGYGLYALVHRERRPLWVVAGALPVATLVVATFVAAPFAFYFGTLRFPTEAPADYYLAAGRAWKLAGWVKALDVLKFLALGPALLALVLVARRHGRRPELVDWMILAGLLGGLLPTPTWRQYLLPMLPPLFLRLAMLWQARPPGRRVRIAAVVFAVAGLAPTAEALLKGDGMGTAIREEQALRIAMDAAGVTGPVATLSPQFVPATGRRIDPRFATGPFYFRSHQLLPASEEGPLHVIRATQLASRFASPPSAIVVGGEGRWSAGDDKLDAAMAAWAVRSGWRAVPVAGERLRLYAPPAATAPARPAISPE